MPTIPWLMMFAVNLVCYPWDLEDGGVDDILDHVQGELGVSGITVVAAGRPVSQLRRHPHASPRIFRSSGGFYFQPDDREYSATRCKPVASEWLKARKPLAKISEACQRRDMHLRAVIDTRRIGRIVARSPTVAVRSPFGDVSTGCMCISNPDAAEFLRALVDDLSSNYALSAIELRCLDRPFLTDLLDAVSGASTIGPAGCELFSICFCESCLQSAAHRSIDGNAALRSAQMILAAALQSGRPLEGPLDDLLDGDPMLAQYADHHRDIHRSLLNVLGENTECDLMIHLTAGTDLDRMPQVISGLPSTGMILNLDHPLLREGGDALDRALSFCRKADQMSCEVSIPACEPVSGDGTSLVRIMKQVVDHGASGVALDHFAIMGELEFTAARQAIRYARRSVPD